MKKLALFGVTAALLFAVQSVEAAILVTFKAGDAAANPAASFDVSITCKDFVNVTSFQFSLSWDTAVVQYNSVGSFGMGTLLGQFNQTQTGSGRLGLAWDPVSAGPETYADGTTIFSINFTALGSAGTSSLLQFGDTPTARDVSVNLLPATFSGQDGTITVVPESAHFTLVCAGFLMVVGALRSTRLRFLRK